MDFSEETYLDAVNDRNTKEYIPAIVIITAVISTGLCLNVFAFVYYGCKARKSVFQIFVMSLSINFVITNLVLIHDIVELLYFVKHTSISICKLFYVLKHWFVGNSLIFMVAVGFERYRTVCFPFSNALSFRKAWCIIIGCATFSFGISVSLFATTDIVPIRIRISENITIQGSICSFSKSEQLQVIRKLFHYVNIIIQNIISFLLAFFYIFIVRNLIITRKKVSSDKKKKIEIFKERSGEQSETATELSSTKYGVTSAGQSNEQPQGQSHKQFEENIENSACPNVKLAHIIPSVTEKINPCKTEVRELDQFDVIAEDGTGISLPLKSLSRKKHSKRKTKFERRITVMATIKTVTTIACFAPFYISMLVVSPNLEGDGLVLGVGSILARRSFMLNSVVNPIIMIVFNDAFRQYVKTIFTMLFQRFK